MAKTPRPREEIEHVKERILAAALDIIIREGYENLSMRNIARRTGMTAANIYNYFSSKDELYLTLLKRAFEKLLSSIRAITRQHTTPIETLLNVGEVYIDFAINNKNYYDVMLTTSAPRTKDFEGTKLEKVAYETREMGLSVFNYILEIVMNAFPMVPRERARLYLLKLWSTLHGAVSLYNYAILSEIDDNPSETLNQIKETAFKQFRKEMEEMSEVEKEADKTQSAS